MFAYIGVGVERPRGVGKGPDFRLMVVVVAWPVERSGALPKIKVGVGVESLREVGKRPDF